MDIRPSCCILYVSVALAFNVNAKNQYSEWVQKNASNLIEPMVADDTARNSGAPMLLRIKESALSCKDEWSGSLNDLKALVDQAKQKYGSESTKHRGRNATMLIPANLGEMIRWQKRGFKALGDWTAPHIWNSAGWDGYHAKNASMDDGKAMALVKRFGSGVEKYVVKTGVFKGAEVVYDKETGVIVKDWRMGTRNFSYVIDGGYDEHERYDMTTHENNPNYKYVGILIETDPSNPDKYYIVNGQTDKRMTWREAEDFPTTLSDEWRNLGLACVVDDAKDVIRPDPCRDEAKCTTETKQSDLHSRSCDNPNGDWDCCKCENPNDSDFYCKKCGKLSKWLAPKPDLEFLQWLKKGSGK